MNIAHPFREGKSGYTHGHEALCNIDRKTEHLKKSSNAGGEDLERSSYCCGTVSGCGGACYTECKYG